MILLTAASQAAQPDYVALAMVLVLAVIVSVMAIRKRFAPKKAAAPEPAPVVPAPADAPTAPGSAGEVKLYDVAPKTAAMLMAIVAEKTGKPLNELRFVSIEEVK